MSFGKDNIIRGVIKRRRLLKPDEASNEMESATPQTQQPIMYTNKEGFQEPRPKDDQGTIPLVFWVPKGTTLDL